MGENAMTPIVDIRDLHKTYHDGTYSIEALRGVSFQVHAGEVFGLMGPNGAGKTTTVGILSTRIRPGHGVVRVADLDPVRQAVALKRLIAIVPQKTNLDRSLSVIENLHFHAEYFGVPRPVREAKACELLSWLGLTERRDSSVDKLSGGQVQRVMIARALMHDPCILFLDEPTLGLDPTSRVALWQRIRELRQYGLTIFLTTNNMDEAEHLCDRVAVMDRGRVLALGTPRELKQLLPAGDLLDLVLDPIDEEVVRRFAAHALVAGSEKHGNQLRLYLQGGSECLPRLLQDFQQDLARIANMHIAHASLEDVFFHLTGKDLQ